MKGIIRKNAFIRAFAAFFLLLLWIPFSLNSQETKVLFLGNSYTFFNDLPLQFESLANAAGYDISVDWSTPGGCTLSNPSNGHLYTEASLEKINAKEWNYVIAEDETLPLFHNDGSHPSPEGTYLAACTFYAAIFHESPVGLDYYYTLPEATATFLQQIAASTVLDDLNKWNIDTTSIFVEFDYTQNEDTIDFINDTENADSYLWEFGDGTTDTTENPVHIYDSTGVFEAVLTAYKFCDSSSTSKLVKILIASDGNEIKSENSINIFPNPSNGIVTLKPVNDRESYDLTISAMDGKIIFKENNFISDGISRNLDLSGFPPNLYIFKMSNKKGLVFKQIVLK